MKVREGAMIIESDDWFLADKKGIATNNDIIHIGSIRCGMLIN